MTFSQPVTVSTVSGTPTIGLEVGTEIRQAAYARKAGPAVLVFDYPVREEDGDMVDGIAVPADGILLEGGTIVDAHGIAALLGHAAVAADVAHKVDGSDVVPMGGVCERTPQVRDALVAKARANDAAVTDCSQVGDDDGIDELAGIVGALQLHTRGIAALKPGDFEGLSGVTALYLNDNALSALPAGVFDGLGAVEVLTLNHNALGAGSLEDGVFEPLTGLSTRLSTLDLAANPGSGSFVPKADAGEDLVLRAGESATLGGSGTGGGPWGTNVEYEWVEVDAEDNLVAETERTAGLSAADRARGGLHGAGARRGAGGALPVHGPGPGVWQHRFLHRERHGHGHGAGGAGGDGGGGDVGAAERDREIPAGRADRGERDLLGAGDGDRDADDRARGGAGDAAGGVFDEHGAECAGVRLHGGTADDTDDDGIAVPANGIRLAGGTIADARAGRRGSGTQRWRRTRRTRSMAAGRRR